jgi:regulator of ribonuclease activity A
MTISTADLSDAWPNQVQVAHPGLHDYGGTTRFSGPIATVWVDEDNSAVRSLLEEDGNGRVLVVDGGGSLRCALVGDKLAQLAVDNGWAGIVVNGCVRDSAALDEMSIGVKALGTMPRRSEKGGGGHAGLPVNFCGVSFVPGHYLYADEDGIVVSAVALE